MFHITTSLSLSLKHIPVGAARVASVARRSLATPSTVSMPKTDRKVINSEGREFVAKVYHFMKSEAKNGVERLKDARWRTSQATGVSETTITRILREERNLPTPTSKFANPMKNRKKRAPKFDAAKAEIVRSTINSYHMEHKKLPSLRKLKQILVDKVNFKGSVSTLRRFLLKLGYDWFTTPADRKSLIDQKKKDAKMKAKKLEEMQHSNIPPHFQIQQPPNNIDPLARRTF